MFERLLPRSIQDANILVYLPAGGTVRVDLSAASGSFVASWFSPITGRTTSGGTVSAGIPILFTSPIDGDAVLYLQAMPALSSQSSDHLRRFVIFRYGSNCSGNIDPSIKLITFQYGSPLQ